MLRLAAASLAAVAALAGGKHARPLVVATDRGPVLGATVLGMHEWLGIPYAAPPVGALRWQPPQLHARWTAVRPATSFGAICPQPAGPFGDASTNESCLYLNVFAPAHATAGSRLPVMFWIHGGAFISGESNDYIPTALVSHGVVVVTINYRLGLLGFLAHPALGSDSGDYGLMDQQFALQWVQRNIAHFGGNPANVTIFGQSAGGLSVMNLLASPTAAALFRGAIIESGAYALHYLP